MADLDYVRVVGRFGIVVRDEATDDPNLEPDTIWCDAGTILFTPLITAVKVVDATPVPVTLGQSVIEGEIDADGYLSLRGTREIQFVDLGSTKVNPYIGAGKATHKVEFLGLSADGVPVNLPSPVNVRLSADMVSPMGTIDLTLVSPVPVAGGTAQVVGPAGPSAYEGWLAQGNTGTFDDFMAEGFADNESYVSALTSAQNAANSATAALASQNAAASSATAAASSATAASGSASAASTSASNASGSATAAAGSATSASTSASTATTKASEASTSATNAAGSATAAASSATNAATSATNASNSASSAGTSASNASNSATTATTKANEASASASQAASAASGAVAVAVGGSLPQLYVNYLTNPSFEVDTQGASAFVSGTTISRVTTEAYVGSASIQVATNGASSGQGLQFTSATVPAGTYRGSVWVKAPVGTSLNLVISNAANTVFTATGAWQRVTTPPQLISVSGAPSLRVLTTSAQAVTFYVDAAMVLVGSGEHPPYFDGSSPGCYWTGTANASTSVKMVFNRDDLDPVVRTDRSATPVTNLIQNPLPTSTFNYTAGRGTLSYEDVTKSLVLTVNDAAVGDLNQRVQPGTDYFSVVSGRLYVGSAMISSSVSGFSGRIRILWYNDAITSLGVSSGSDFVVSSVDSFGRVSVIATAPSGATKAVLQIGNSPGQTTTIGQQIKIKNVSLVSGDTELRDYFDGDSKWSHWTGTPHNSTSVYAPPQAEDLVLKRNVPTVYTNLITNPSFETGLSGWAGRNTGSIARASSGRSGSSSLRVTAGATTNASHLGYDYTNLVVGRTYTISAYVKSENLSGGRGVRLGAPNGGFFVPTSTSDWSRLTSTFVATAASGTFFFGAALAADVFNAVTGESFLIDDVMLTETPHPVDYFDGSSPGCEWTGTPHASTSIKRFKSKQVDLNKIPTYAENLLPQPKASDVQNLWSSAGTNTTFTKSGKDFVLTAIASGNVIIQTGGGAPNINHARVEPGKQYNIRGKFKAATTSRAVQLDYGTYNEFGSGSYHASPVSLTDNSSGYTEISYNITVPEGRTYLRLVPIVLSAAAGETHYLTEFSVVEVSGISNSYFDGDTEGCYWTGTPNASTSVKKFPKRDDVVLTSRMPELARNWFSASPAFTVDYSGLYGSTLPTKSVIAGRSPGVNAIRVVHNSVGGDHGIQIGPSGLDAGNYNLTLLYRNNSANPVNVRVRTINGDSGSPQSTGATAITLPGNSGWVRHTHWFNMSAVGFAKIRVLEFYDNGNPGASVDVTEPVLTLGPNPNVEFFSGDTPGCRWLGVPELSPSIRVLHSPADYSFLTWLDAGRAQGVGSPEGRVTGTVGTRYVDTAATNGAIEWIKASGTGNTGWKVTHGDTGWRDVSSLLVNGWVGFVHVRRTADLVHWGFSQVDHANATSDDFIINMNLSLMGFRASPHGVATYFPLATQSPDRNTPQARQFNNIMAIPGRTSLTTGSKIYATTNSICSDPWPSTLPGTT